MATITLQSVKDRVEIEINSKRDAMIAAAPAHIKDEIIAKLAKMVELVRSKDNDFWASVADLTTTQIIGALLRETR